MTPDQDLSAPNGQPFVTGINFTSDTCMITLADHERAVQAAVAKAVEAALNAENEACAKMLDNAADDYEADASRFLGGTNPHHYRKDLANTARKYAAAIRSRGVAG